MVDQATLAAMRQQQHDLNDAIIQAHVNDYGVCMKSDISYMDAKGIQHVFKSYEGQSNVLDHVFNVLFPEYEESICANNDIIHYLKEKINSKVKREDRI